MAAFIIGLGIGVGPFLWACMTNPQIAWGRAGSQFVFSRGSSFAESLGLAARSYAAQVSPSFLFQCGDPSLIQAVPGHGELYWVCAPLMAIGLWRVIRNRHSEPVGRLLLFWLIVAPIPAALTKLEAGHSLRAATALPAYQILSGLGIDFLVAWSASCGVVAARTVAASVGVALAGCAARFIYLFFWSYPLAAAPVFFQEWQPVVEEVQRRQRDYDLVLLSSRECGQNGRLYLFWSGLAPETYFREPRNIWEGPEWDVILQVGKVFFVPYENVKELIPQLPPDIRRPRVLVAELPGVDVPGVPLKRFTYSDGRESMILYDVQLHR
jgi:hypothetical protein